MILPGKYIPAHRSLVAIGGEILSSLTEPRSVSDVWESVKARRANLTDMAPLSYDWFVLALTFLNAISAVRLDGHLLSVEPTR